MIVESALDLASKGFRIFPLKPNSKLPAVSAFYDEATTDETKIKNWWKRNPKFNIGISTDEWCVLDVDTKNANGFETLKGKTLPNAFFQVTPTGGRHYFFKAPHPIKNSVAKLGPGLDVRGFHGYVVGAGSLIGGEKYWYQDGPTPESPKWLLQGIEKVSTQTPKEPKKAIPVKAERALSQARAYLASQEAISGERNNAGYVVANKLKDFGLDKDEVFLTIMEEWNCSPPLELDELRAVVNSAFTYGTEAQGSASPEAAFAERVDETPDEGHPIENFNKRFAVVAIEGKHAILEETTDEKGKAVTKLWSENSFHVMHQAKKHHLDGGKSIPFTKYWMGHEKRRSYEGLIFAPGINRGPRFYNLWRGFAVTEFKPEEKIPAEAIRAVELFKEHILENVCGGNIEHAAWVTAWFAHIIQKPWEKPGTALVLKGEKGVGKNIIMECVERLMPENYLLTANRRYMTGNFNSIMENKILGVYDEVSWGGEKEAESILKDLITGRHTLIEQKGINPYRVDSCLRVVIIGNEDWLVAASGEERRYAVFEVGNSRRQDRKFFSAINDGMLNGGARLLFSFLKNLDISKIDVKTAPKTEGLLAQKAKSLEPLEQFWFDSLFQGYLEGITSDFNGGGWMTTVDKNAFNHALSIACSRRNIRSRLPTDNEVFNKLQKIVPSLKLVANKETKLMEYIFPPLERARYEWDKYLGQKTNWRVV